MSSPTRLKTSARKVTEEDEARAEGQDTVLTYPGIDGEAAIAMRTIDAVWGGAELKPIPQTGAPDGRVEPSSSPHDRGHDDPEHVAGDTAILRQRGFEVQPVFRPLAG